MEPWGRSKHNLIKEEPADYDDGDICRQQQQQERATTTQAMGLDRIMTPTPSSASTMPVAWRLSTTAATASDYAKSSASTAAPTSTATASSRIPAQDIILSTLHQLLDPTLQPPPPQPHHQLPRRPATHVASPSANDANDITNRSSSSTTITGSRTRPPLPTSSSSSSSSSSGRVAQHHQRLESSAGVSANAQRGAPPPTAISFPGSAPGLPALVQDLSALPHLLQVAAFSGISPQAILASLATALPAAADPLQLQPQRQGLAAMGSSSAATGSSSAATTTTTPSAKAPAQMPHIPDPTYPRVVTTAHKLPLPKAHSVGGGLSFTPSVTSAFTSLKRPGQVVRSSPPHSPNPPPLSSAGATRTTGKPTPTSSVPLPALAVPGILGLPPADYAATLAALAASQPPMATPAGAATITIDHQAQMQQYMQFLHLLQQQQQQPQQQLPPGFAVAPLPYITTPLVPIINTPASSSSSSSPFPSSTSTTSTSSSGKRAREIVKQESGAAKRSRGSRDDCSVTGRTSSNAGLAPTGDTAASRKRTRSDDQYGQLTDLGPPPRPAGATRDGGSSAQPTPRRRAAASFGDDDDDDAVKRKRINQSQLDVLEAAYLDDPLPSRRTKQRLSTQLGISIKRVQIWFQNRRAKQKRQRKDGSDSGGDTFPEDGSDDPPSGGLFGLMD